MCGRRAHCCWQRAENQRIERGWEENLKVTGYEKDF